MHRDRYVGTKQGASVSSSGATPFQDFDAFTNPDLSKPGGSCLVTQSWPTLCNHMDFSPPGSFVHEIFQARILEWVAISYSRGSSQPRDQTCNCGVSCIGRQILYHWATWKFPQTWKEVLNRHNQLNHWPPVIKFNFSSLSFLIVRG